MSWNKIVGRSVDITVVSTAVPPIYSIAKRIWARIGTWQRGSVAAWQLDVPIQNAMWEKFQEGAKRGRL
jgi:hypothetical protein